MLKDKLSLVILSCDNFSDLWISHIEQLEKFWGDREIETFIVTDKITDKKIKNVNIISCGENVEYTDRIKFSLNQIKTKYVLITLDDYFLKRRVENSKIESLVEMMENENLDYVRMFKRPKRATRDIFKNYKNIKNIDLNCNYSVNLYSCIWKRQFMLDTVEKPLSPWLYEVSLHNIAKRLNAKCVVSLNNEFIILDVVRKGRILHEAALYFKLHNMKVTNRPICPLSYEIKLWIQTKAARHLPGKLRDFAKSYMTKKGMKFFSDDAVNEENNISISEE